MEWERYVVQKWACENAKKMGNTGLGCLPVD